MRISVDATCWANERGYGRFTRELVRAMVADAPNDEFVCLMDARARETFTLEAPNVSPVVVAQRVSPTLAASVSSARSLGDMLRLTRAVARARADVFFSPTVYTYFLLLPGARAVVTVHDAIAERFPARIFPRAARDTPGSGVERPPSPADRQPLLALPGAARGCLGRGIGTAPVGGPLRALAQRPAVPASLAAQHRGDRPGTAARGFFAAARVDAARTLETERVRLPSSLQRAASAYDVLRRIPLARALVRRIAPVEAGGTAP